jgi:hypothetical protein
LVQNSSQRMVMLGSGPSHTGGDGTPQMSFGYNDVDRFNTYGSMSAANNNQTWDVTTRGDEPDKWHHFCFQKYSSNMGMIWIDGQAQNVGDFGSNFQICYVMILFLELMILTRQTNPLWLM